MFEKFESEKGGLPWNSDPPLTGGGSGFLTPKNHEKMRFRKGYRMLTTNQPCEKTQLTKVVSPLKRFGRHSNTHRENRNFLLKNSLSDPPQPSTPQTPHREGIWGANFEWKTRFSSWVFEWWPNLFRGETTLVSCVFLLGWIVVNARQPLWNRNFSWIFR